MLKQTHKVHPQNSAGLTSLAPNNKGYGSSISSISKLYNSLKPDRSLFLLVVILSFSWASFQLILIYALKLQGYWSANLYRDPISIGNLPLHSGLISNFGCMLMTAAASCALLTYAVLDVDARRQKRFLLWGGLLSALLAVDDLFLLHEGFLGRIGVPEAITLLIYGALVLLWLTHFRSSLFLNHPRPIFLLFLALLGLGTSATIDVLLEPIIPSIGPMEEIPKQMGLFFWLLFFFLTCRDTIRRAIERPGLLASE
jgi:hypothetical protein